MSRYLRDKAAVSTNEKWPLQIVFQSGPASNKELINLYFESASKTDTVCHLINQLCENHEVRLSVSAPFQEQPVLSKCRAPAELAANLKHLNASYHEIRLSLALHCPKLSIIAQSPPDEIESFCYSKSDNADTTKILGIIWAKFLVRQFDVGDASGAVRQETPGLVCVAADRIFVVYEAEDVVVSETDCWSDPESDQPDSSCVQTKLVTIPVELARVFKIYMGLYHQWVTLCCRSDEHGSETWRLVLVLRNNELARQLVNWLKLTFKEQSLPDDVFAGRFECRHDDSNVDELLFQIRNTAKCDDVDLIHYTSVEDVRFDYPLVGLWIID